ncbi:MAG: N-acetylglucosamine-6-phosphate deacetylase [Agriterribacter sp.]
MNKAVDDITPNAIACINCVTGAAETLHFAGEQLISISNGGEATNTCYGPGLIDLQINGVNGIDFNVPTLTEEQLRNCVSYLLSTGVTTFFPTVITNSDENILTIMRTLSGACRQHALLDACIGGIHLEGPFISPQPGAKGAHSETFIKPPDWQLFLRFQEAADGKIKIVTIAPEWEGSISFIENCVESGVIVSIGHSLANTQQIADAVKAGARMSTHLGNGVPLLLPRHPNLIWDQLAEEALYSCLIADGIHIPDAFIKSVRKIKGNAALIVSDATCFAGMAPGEYQMHIGGTVVLDSNKRVSVKDQPGILAGAAKTLLENVETLVQHGLCDTGAAWQMASENVYQFLARCGKDIIQQHNDRVIFSVEENSIKVQKTIKNGRVVFDANAQPATFKHGN